MKGNSPTYQMFLIIKKQQPDTLVLFKEGDGYLNAFDQDAVTISEVTGRELIQLSDGHKMTGFEEKDTEAEVLKLLKAGHKVAIAEPVTGEEKKDFLREHGADIQKRFSQPL